MELLQYRRYEAGKIPYNYFHEIRTLIESLIDVCQEGEISMYEADCIIHKELLSCYDYQDELEKKLDNLENSIDEVIDYNEEITPYDEILYGGTFSFSQDELAALEEIDKDWKKKALEIALEDMENYNNFLIETQDKLYEIFESADYQKKRKAKIKQKIIRDGLKLSPEMADNTNTRTSKMEITERSLNYLITRFPKLVKDYPLLIKYKFIKTTEKGLRRGDKISKLFLADYFKSIKPPKMERMPWTMLESIFDEKDMKNSSTTNGKKYKEGSEDFIRWLELIKSLADK